MWRTNISYLPAKMTILITWRLFRDSNIPVIKRCQGEPVFEQIDLCVVNNINTVSGYGIVIDARIDPDSVSGGKGSRSRGNIIGNLIVRLTVAPQSSHLPSPFASVWSAYS